MAGVGRSIGGDRAGWQVPWPCAPIVSGFWRDLGSHEVAEIAASLPPRVARTGLPLALVQGRELPIRSLPGWSIQELAADSAIGHRAVLRLLSDGVTMLPLDGTGTPFKIACTGGFRGGDAAAIGQYLRLFTSLVRHEETPFTLLETADHKTGKALPAPTPLDIVLTADGAICRGFVAFGRELYDATFFIGPTGDVELTEEAYVSEIPRPQPRIFSGSWQFFSIH